MKQPRDISLGKGWTVRFENGEMPVFLEYRKSGKTYGASLAFFEQNFTTSCDEYEFEANEELIYAWEQDWFDRNPREE